jgi:hypothetical protein
LNETGGLPAPIDYYTNIEVICTNNKRNKGYKGIKPEAKEISIAIL